MSSTAPEGVLSMEEMARLNEMREVATQGQNLSPEDKESLTRVTDELSHVGKVAERPDEQTLYVPDSKSKGEEGSEHLQLQLHQYSDSLKGILSMEELVVTEGQDLFPQDEESLTKLTEDLSGTSMYTFPQHIFRLVTLQKLLLRNCEILMMELPPEIGELKNLEVLDLEGTEILCLPMEIAKLVNLTCLKVSFYGYANQTVIPKTVLSNLSRLKELIIDVTPYGEWWDVEVKAIIDDLRSLKELTTLKLYLPTAELLEDLTLIFPDLANFRFTVGRQKEHFISRLPQDVEEEFNNQEKLEKGLKFINGNCIPNEITKVLNHANAFFLQCHWIAESLSEFGHENLNEVKFLLVMDCNEFRTIIDFEKLYQRKDGSAESEVFQDFNEATVLGSLERLIIRYMKNMESIWKGSVANGSLSNLKSLALHTCPKLTTLFTINMLSNLINLEELIVEDCPKISSLVSLQNSSSKSMHFLPSLKKISLLYLPRLISISSGLGIAPKLERMVVFYCPKLEKLSATEVSSTGLKVIKGEKEWWDALKWYESDLSTEDEDHLDCLFIPLRRDGDLMAQLTEDEFGGYGQGEVGSSKIPDPPSEEISSEESEEISSEESEETPSNPREILDPPSEEISLEESEETHPREILGSVKDTISVAQSLRTSMASSSNSEFEVIYDIFLSFRGLDTRHRFIDHLYKALKQEGFKMFEDGDEIPIKSELGKAIMNSRMSVIVLSKNYTNSTTCLFELQKILERREMSDHFVLPVYYEVDPSEIKEQAKNLDFGEKKVTVDKVKEWSAALKEVAGMAGMVFQNQSSRYEAKFIEEIVGVLKTKLTDERPIGRLLIPPTKDFVDSTEGRNKENVWKCLMNEDFRKIGVYGMGGVGKTTIMKHIHNLLLEERGKFDNVFWVTVSKEFNITTLQRDIGNRLSLSFSDPEDETDRSSELHAELSRKKRYVLILDDLWQAFSLESVGIPEPTRSSGCKLVLTTRSLEVCRRMECKAVKVELLTEQEALTLFLSVAVGHDTMLAPEVEYIATEVAKECACLPLAIVTVAGSMKGLNGKHEWRNALNELISSTNDANDAESEVFERLKFSYSRLGSKLLQDCFLYCSLYPEDHDIPVKELVEYWIAEGLIIEMTSVEAKLDKGHALLGKLTSSCLLEHSTNGEGQECVVMHDLIRDMALRITQISPRFMVKSGVYLESVSSEEWSEDLERISLMYNRIEELPTRPPDCPRLTTLLLRQNSLSEIPDSFFTYIRGLEVLDLSHNSLIKSLPESISNLENLHALILAECYGIEYVPSLEKMKALKVFKLTRSWIKEAPKGIEELVSLRELDLSYNRRLETFPSSMLYRLSKLQCLRLEETPVEVLAKDLVCLRQLKVVAIRLHNIRELTAYVTSQRVQGLENYLLLVGEIGYPDDFRLSYGEKIVRIDIESEPYRCGVDKVVLPNNVTYLELRGFHDLISLLTIPGLKNATHLRTVKVHRCDGLESIFSSSSFSEDGEISLRTVEDFSLSDLPSFRVLFDGIAPPRNISFNLKRLRLVGCDSVKSIFPVQLLQNFPTLEVLVVEECENVEDVIVGEEEMSGSNTITLPRLRELYLRSLPRLKSIYTGIMVCESVERFSVWDCPMVRRLPLSLHMNNDQATAPPALKSLEWDDPLTKTILEPFWGR